MKILNSLTYWNNNLKIDQIFPWKNQNGESTCRKTNSWCTSNTFKRVQSILRPFFRISICVALALVHFSTLLSLCYYYFFFFSPYLFLLQLFRNLFFSFLLTWKLQPAFTANFVDSFLLFLLAHFNLSIFHENDRCALLPVWSTLSVHLIATI